jgi:hypothetical protein
VRRQKLPKSLAAAAAGTGATLKASDFFVGRPVEIFGRTLLVYDCDPFTRAYMEQFLGVQQPPALDIAEPAPEPLVRVRALSLSLSPHAL